MDWRRGGLHKVHRDEMEDGKDGEARKMQRLKLWEASPRVELQEHRARAVDSSVSNR